MIDDRRTELHQWGLAVFLALPAFLPLLAHYAGAYMHGMHPTGFIAYDMAVYIANAREHFDDGRFSLMYGNPFSFDYGTPKIYFQPLTLAMALLWIIGLKPEIAFAVAGVITAILCARVAISLYDQYAKSARYRITGLIAFFWGGGVLVIAACIHAAIPGTSNFWILRFDPADGLWFLSFGRNMIFPTEALYHAIFLFTLIALTRSRYGQAVAAMLIMSISHPFTGIQLILVCLAWAALEVIAVRNKNVPVWFPFIVVMLGLMHVGYYLLFLRQFAEHRAVQEQWTLPLLVGAKLLVASVILVGMPAAWRFRTVARAREVISDPANRLMLVMFIVSFVLAKHEWFLNKPIQPIHFTRGYQWIALFMLALPALLSFWGWIRTSRSRLVSVGVAVAVFTIMLSDNLAWFSLRTAQALGTGFPQLGLKEPSLGMSLDKEGFELMDWLNRPENRKSVVASENPEVGYLVTAYTPLRSWHSHEFNTPYESQRLAELKVFFEGAKPPAMWQRLPMLIVFNASGNWTRSLSALNAGAAKVVWRNSRYVLVRVTPLLELSSTGRVNRF